MIDLSFLPGLALVHATATLSPGPNFAVVFDSASVPGSRAPVRGVVAGVVTGIFLHCALAIFGFSLLLASNENLLNGVKVLGACYLLYLGYSSLKSLLQMLKKSSSASTMAAENLLSQSEGGFSAGYLKGFTTCILNPKAFLYFASVFPQALSSALSPTQAMAALAILTCITLLWFSSLAGAVSKISQKQLAVYRGLMKLVTGVLFLSLSFSIFREFLS